jgi:hypothetical protein
MQAVDVPIIRRQSGLILCTVWLSQSIVVCPHGVVARRLFIMGLHLFEVLFSTANISGALCWICINLRNKKGPGSAVGIATGYGLDGPGIEFRLGRHFPHLSRPALGPTQPPAQWVPSLSRR